MTRTRSTLIITTALAAATMATVATLLAGAAASSSADGARDAALVREVEKWREERLARLTAPDGWLSLVGLFWLHEGENTFGSDPSNAVVLPAAAPRFTGTLSLADGVVEARVNPGMTVTVDGRAISRLRLTTDAAAEPTVLRLSTISLFVIDRGGRLGVRVRDSASPNRQSFKGVEYFPIRAEWRKEATYEPHATPKQIATPTVAGTVEKLTSPGAVVFAVDGAAQRLDIIAEDDGSLSLLFADATSGHETYGGGRFLDLPPVRDGHVVVDFNEAYNPPCYFTRFATCPLPPPQNRLRVRVEAGEKAQPH